MGAQILRDEATTRDSMKSLAVPICSPPHPSLAATFGENLARCIYAPHRYQEFQEIPTNNVGNIVAFSSSFLQVLRVTRYGGMKKTRFSWKILFLSQIPHSFKSFGRRIHTRRRLYRVGWPVTFITESRNHNNERTCAPRPARTACIPTGAKRLRVLIGALERSQRAHRNPRSNVGGVKY